MFHEVLELTYSPIRRSSWVSPFSHRTSGSKSSTTLSPAQELSKPAESGLQIIETEARVAQGPSTPLNQINETTSLMSQRPANSTNLGMQIAQTTPRLTKKGTRTPLTKEQQLNRHKRAEEVRRNRIGTCYQSIRDQWIAEEFKLPGNKKNKRYESLVAAGDWLEQMQSGNDELEGILNALKDTYGLLTEGYPTSQAQARQQQGLPPSPPLSQSPSDHQPSAFFPPSFPEYGQGQLPSPPANPFQRSPSALHDDPMVTEDVFPVSRSLAPNPPLGPQQDLARYPPDPHDPRMFSEQEFMRSMS